jgi:hypothetical protein
MSADEDIFDGAVRKAVGNVLASMRAANDAEHKDNEARDFATYTALRAGAVALDQFDDPSALEHLVLMATDAYGLNPDLAQHAIAEGTREAREAREINGGNTYTNGHAKSYANAEPIPLVFPFPIRGEEIPLRPWIVPGLLLRRHVTMLVAPPGSGKPAHASTRHGLCGRPRRMGRLAAARSNDRRHRGGRDARRDRGVPAPKQQASTPA